MKQLPLDFSNLPHEETILVACSGGADSSALLLALQQAEYPCVAAHVNHGTRGVENEGDENFVRASCENLRIPFALAQLHLPSESSEAILREARYEALLQLAREYSCPRIATAHHADDVLETMILNLLRDATSVGWSGISPMRALAERVLLVRPLLKATRKEIMAFLKDANWKWREDSSNRSARYLRNRVRNELVPQLVEISGGDCARIARQAGRSAEILREDFSVLENLASSHLQNLTLCDEQNLLVLDGLKFRELPIALQRRVLRLCVGKLEGHTRDVGFERIEEARRHIGENKRRAVWMWKKTLSVEWTGAMAGNRIRFKGVGAEAG